MINKNLPIPILSVLLFLNCIITIFMYNNSHCKEKGISCNAYVKFPTPQQDANTQTITFDLKKAQPYCDPTANLKNSSTVAVLVFSILFFIASAVVGVVGFIFNKEPKDRVWIILLAVLNLIVSAFNWTIYDNCLDSMNCDTNKVNYVDGKGLIASCYKSIYNHGTYGMYVFMIVLLIASIGSTIGGIYYSL